MNVHERYYCFKFLSVDPPSERLGEIYTGEIDGMV